MSRLLIGSPVPRDKFWNTKLAYYHHNSPLLLDTPVDVDVAGICSLPVTVGHT